MKFLSAQSDNDYHIWQLQVQMFNFRKFGIEDKAIILLGYNVKIGVSVKALEFKDNTSAMVIFLPDERDLSDRLYTQSIRPHLIKQLYLHHPHLLENRTILIHDCQILFTKLPSVKKLITKRKIYVSQFHVDPIDQRLLKEMYKMVGISSSRVDKNKNLIGGIQYLFNSSLNFSYDFWNKIENDSNSLYKLMLVNSERVNPSWSAEIWAMLWNIWLVGIDTEINSELSFTTGNTPIEELENKNIYYNDDPLEDQTKKIFKRKDYIKETPFSSDLSYVDPLFCSSFYAKEIIETGNYLNL
jgi:hypothetical protein